jgi:hypothetical protein
MYMTRYHYYCVFLFIAVIMLTACRQHTDKEHPYSFYYWRTSLSLDSIELAALERSTGDNLYLRFFDVDKVNGAIEPVGIIKDDYKQPLPKRVVPVVFIANRVWEGITPKEIGLLAERIAASAGYIRNKYNFNEATEIQFDSDWTATTREAYFAFLTYFAELSGIEVTSTLRLHQVKDAKVMGIPPVKKCYLMCYATGSPLDNKQENSILDINMLESYLQNLHEYPLRLDIALPIYSRALITNHSGEIQIVNSWTSKMLKDAGFFKWVSDGVFEVMEDGFFQGIYLHEGFLVKLEEIDKDLIGRTKSVVEIKLKDDYNYIYYHLDGDFLANYPPLLP